MADFRWHSNRALTLAIRGMRIAGPDTNRQVSPEIALCPKMGWLPQANTILRCCTQITLLAYSFLPWMIK